MSCWIRVCVCQVRQSGLLAALWEGSWCWAALLPTKSSCQPSEKMSYLGWRPRTVSRLDNAASRRRRDRPNKDASHLSTDCKRQTDVSDLHCNWNWATAPVFMDSLEDESWEGAAVAQSQNWLHWNETAHVFQMLVARYCTKNANTQTDTQRTASLCID